MPDNDAFLTFALNVDNGVDVYFLFCFLKSLDLNLHRIGYFLIVVEQYFLANYLADEETRWLIGKLIFVEIGRRFGQQLLYSAQKEVGAELVFGRNG